MSRLLTAQNLTISSGPRELVHNIGFTIDRGERVGLIGESGSGKSLTCLSVMGLLPDGLTATGSMTLHEDDDATKGKLADLDLLDADEDQFSTVRGNRLSMVFQEPMTALNPLMKVGAQVAEVIKLHQSSGRQGTQAGSPDVSLKNQVVELLDSVQIPDPVRAANVYPHQMSGGQRQRVMLAMAMANEPELLLADEPTTALDVTVQKQVLNLMSAQVERAGSSLLFITHDLGVVSEICERVMIMRHGRIVESGTIDKVFSAPEHPYTRSLLAASSLETHPTTGRLLTSDTMNNTAQGEIASSRSSRTDSVNAAQKRELVAEHLSGSDADSPSVFNAAESPMISVRNLSRSYGRPGMFGRGRVVEALRGVSFDVAAGQRFGIVGESGCGKSTLLRLLTALDEPTSGTVSVNGRPITGQPERQRRWLRESMQIVFQDPMGSLDPRMTIAEIITEPLLKASRSDRLKRAQELLDQVGLPRVAAGKYPHEFSGGQRQRVAIARALVTRPNILIADEAVSALDVSVRAQVLNLFDDLVEQYDLTTVFVSHDLNVIRHSCDVVAVMQAGLIVECGPVDAVFDSPKHPYTAELADSIPQVRNNVA